MWVCGCQAASVPDVFLDLLKSSDCGRPATPTAVSLVQKVGWRGRSHVSSPLNPPSECISRAVWKLWWAQTCCGNGGRQADDSMHARVESYPDMFSGRE